MTAARFAGFWSTRNNHGLAQERRVCVLTPRSFRKLPRPFRSFPELPEASGNLPEASGSFPEELYKASDFNELNARRRATSAARRRASRTSLEHGDKSTNNITPDCDRVLSSKVYEATYELVPIVAATTRQRGDRRNQNIEKKTTDISITNYSYMCTSINVS